MKKQSLNGKHILILGLGQYPCGSGMGAALYCLKQGAHILIADKQKRTALKHQLHAFKSYTKVTYTFGRQGTHLLDGMDIVVQNPGIPRNHPVLRKARRDGIPIETDVSLFLQAARPRKVIGITGTRGKSTTAALVHAMLRRSKKKAILAGNIQRSPLFDITKVKPSTWVVLELSSWQIEGLAHLAWSPRIAVVTNIYRDHLNTYPTFASYIRAKSMLLDHQTKQNIAILNRENMHTRTMGKKVLGRRWWVSSRSFPEENGVYIHKGFIVQRLNGKERSIFDLRTTALSGEHSQMNIANATAAALSVGATRVGIQQTVHTFQGLPGRLEIVRTVGGVHYINDTTATIPEATIAAVKAVQKPIALIAGGTDKKLSYREMGPVVAKHAKACILLPGTATTKMIRSFPSSLRKRCIRVKTMREAVRTAQQSITASGSILLSPGATSFGLFVNEFDRGDQFTNVVRSL